MTYTFDGIVQFQPSELDKMYQDTFGYKTNGTFVEVGAYDGKTYSHTIGLAQLGWRGVYIEPVPSLAAACMKNHENSPNVTVLRCAAGAIDGTSMLHVDENSVCGSTLNPNVCKNDKPIQVQVRTLDRILEFEGIEWGFDLLSIDVEFAECEVLKGFNCARWMPKMIIIELCETHGGEKQEWAAPAREMAGKMFGDFHYRKIYSDAINTIFVRE